MSTTGRHHRGHQRRRSRSLSCNWGEPRPQNRHHRSSRDGRSRKRSRSRSRRRRSRSHGHDIRRHRRRSRSRSWGDDRERRVRDRSREGGRYRDRDSTGRARDERRSDGYHRDKYSERDRGWTSFVGDRSQDRRRHDDRDRYRDRGDYNRRNSSVASNGYRRWSRSRSRGWNGKRRSRDDNDKGRRRRSSRRGDDHRKRRNGRERSRSRSRNRSDRRKRDRKRSKKDCRRRRRWSHSKSPSRSPSKAKDDDSSYRDDSIGHFEGGPGSILAGKYRIIDTVGIGTFGRVVGCSVLNGQSGNRDPSNDHSASDTRVAIKIVRNVKRYYESALIEADIVSDLNRRGGRGTSLVSIMYEHFTLPTGHFCMVFELLGQSLYDYLKANKYRPFPLYCVKDFARQLLEAIEFMHSNGLIHTDLKLENILLASANAGKITHVNIDGSTETVPASTQIKIVDFGGATYDTERKSSIINTRQYRAPEVILGLGWSTPSDIWSVGCIIVELYTGSLLFATHDNMEHLAMIEHCVGPFPMDMIKRATAHGEAFGSSGLHRGRDILSSKSMRHVQETPSIENIAAGSDRDSGLTELLRAVLRIDPSRRATASQALNENQSSAFFR